VESGEGIERFSPEPSLDAHFLNVESGEGIERMSLRLYQHRLSAWVGSGEGIERTGSAKSSDRHVKWNPVKELKDLNYEPPKRRE